MNTITETDTGAAAGGPLRGHQRQRLATELATRFVHEDLSIGALAEAANRRPTTVRRLLGEAGVYTTDRSCVGAGAGEIARVLGERYRAGVSLRALAADTGLDRRAIRELLVAAGVALRERPDGAADQVDWLVARYAAGATLRGLAAAVGCSHSTIRRRLLRAGVVLRSR